MAIFSIFQFFGGGSIVSSHRFKHYLSLAIIANSVAFDISGTLRKSAA